MIDGVVLTPLGQIVDERGKVMHWLRSDDPHFAGFGEAYFSVVNAGAIKAWKNHTRMTMNLVTVSGSVLLVLFDDRGDSPTRGQVQEILMGDDPSLYHRVTIPPGVWNGFMGLGQTASVLANLASIPHDPTEALRLPADSADIPYRWHQTDRE